jgi:hypothetical protein
MGIEYKIFPDQSLLFMKAYGILSDKDALETPLIFQDKNYIAGMNELNIYTKVDKISISTEIVSKSKDLIAEYDGMRKGIKVALVGTTSLSYGLCRMYQMMRGNAPYKIEVFRDIEDAVIWLNIDSEFKKLLTTFCA